MGRDDETRNGTVHLLADLATVIAKVIVHTAVCVDLAKCEPKSCAHEYNYVVRLPIQPVKKFTT